MIGDRLKELRKTLGLTQQEFADRLGIKRTAVATYEVGKSNPGDSVVMLVCSKLSVNEAWLRTGEGEMFREVQRDKQIQAFIDEILTDEPEGPKARLVAALAELDERGWEMLVSLAKKMVAENQASAEMQMEEKAHADLQRSMDERKQAEEGSSASSAV